MRTRFDLSDVWYTGDGRPVYVASMDTSHLINIVKMLLTRPDRTMAMLIKDIEEASDIGTVWTPTRSDDLRESINNATSMTDEELIQYVIGTPLFRSLISELEGRGVNTENLLSLYTAKRQEGL